MATSAISLSRDAGSAPVPPGPLAPRLANPAPAPCGGSFADGFAPVAHQFAAQVRAGAEVGAGLTVYLRGQCVVDLWGGLADRSSVTPWSRDTRVVVFSVTKGLAAMAMTLLADRGQLDWDAPWLTIGRALHATAKPASPSGCC